MCPTILNNNMAEGRGMQSQGLETARSQVLAAPSTGGLPGSPVKSCKFLSRIVWCQSSLLNMD